MGKENSVAPAVRWPPLPAAQGAASAPLRQLEERPARLAGLLLRGGRPHLRTSSQGTDGSCHRGAARSRSGHGVGAGRGFTELLPRLTSEARTEGKGPAPPLCVCCRPHCCHPEASGVLSPLYKSVSQLKIVGVG